MHTHVGVVTFVEWAAYYVIFKFFLLLASLRFADTSIGAALALIN